MISVVYSSRNPGEAGVKSVLSVLRSIPRDGEVVFFLDPSNDSSESILSNISDRRFHLITSSSRVGFAEGLNEAIRQAKGEFIARIDADDYCLPWRWRYQAKKMTSLDIHFGSIIHKFSYAGLPLYIPHYPVQLNSDEFNLILTKINPGFHPAAMFRKSVFTALGGYANTLSEDYDFWLRAANSGFRIERGLVPVTIYRHHPSQATATSNWQEMVLTTERILQGQSDLRAYLVKNGLSPKEIWKRLLDKSPVAAIEFRTVAENFRNSADLDRKA